MNEKELSEATMQDLLDEILKRLDAIEMKINPVNPTYPTKPVTAHISTTICGKCGMKWDGVMGYSCTNQPCPVQPSPSFSVSTTTHNFDIESLDPEKRSWFYDGDGTKRKK